MRTNQSHLPFDSCPINRHGRGLLFLAVLLLGLSWLLSGCVPIAVYPLYRETDVTYDPALLGSWKDKTDAKQSWTFTPGEDKSYTLEIQSDDLHGSFVAHLFELEGERLLDIYPAKSALEQKLEKNPYGAALMPGHLFIRVRGIGPTLKMSCMGLEWLNEYLKLNPAAVDHIALPDGRVALTGGTGALQSFIKRHLSESTAWNEMYEDGLVKVDTTTDAK